MAAERLGQTVTRTEEIDSAGLAIVVAEDRGFGLIFG